MPAASQLTFGSPRSFAVTTSYASMGAQVGPSGISTTETDVSWLVRQPGTYSGLQAYVSANGSNTVVLRFRKNVGNGNQILSIGSTANTYFQDTSNIDVVAAGDAIALLYTAATTGTVTVTTFALALTATAGYSTRAGSVAVAATSFTAAATDNLLPFFNTVNGGITNDNSKMVMESSGVAQHLYSNVGTNARTTTTNMRLWKNNAAGNLVIPYTSGQTGIKEDTSNTDTFAAGDTLQTAVSTAAADTSSITVFNVFVDLTNTTSTLTVPQSIQATVNANLTRYVSIGGRALVDATEATAQLKIPCGGVFSNSSVVVSTNSVTATSNLRVRVNGNPGNNVRAIGSGVTGTVTDTSNTDTVAANDLVNLQLATGATGTSLLLRQACLTFAATVTGIWKLAGEGGGLAGPARGLAA